MSARVRIKRLPAACLAALVLMAVLVPLIAPADLRSSDYAQARRGPSWPHVMGTDNLGADVFVQSAAALRISLVVALGAAVVSIVIGVVLGAVAVTFGGRLDRLLMRLTDAVAAVPGLLATLVVVAMFRGSVTAVLAAIALTQWPPVARIVRAEAASVLGSEYYAASRVAGASPWRLIRLHVLPAVLPQTLLALTMLVPHSIWHESTLSFLGIGLQPEQASLGTLIATARAGVLAGQWWPLLFPALLLVVLTLAVSSLFEVRGPRRLLMRRWWVRSDDRRTAAPRGRTATPEQDAPGRAGLDVRDLAVEVVARGDERTICRGVDLEVGPGRVMALVGESGAGKSSVLDACAGLLPVTMRATGRVGVGGVDVDLTSGPGRAGIGHVPQDVSAAFTPLRHLRGQLDEVRRRHGDSRSAEDLAQIVRLDAGLLDRYPHELSGGQLARVALAAALATGPTVLLADEPTAGLDPELSRTVLALLRRVAEETGVSVLVVTHDVLAVAEGGYCTDVAVLRRGELLVSGPVADVFDDGCGGHVRELLDAARHVGFDRGGNER